VGVCPIDALEIVDNTETGKRTLQPAAWVRDINPHATWQDEFALAQCEVCGAIIGTEKSLDYAIGKSRTDDAEDNSVDLIRFLCDKHRRREVAKKLNI
jgi:hypothetical protein